MALTNLKRAARELRTTCALIASVHDSESTVGMLAQTLQRLAEEIESFCESEDSHCTKCGARRIMRHLHYVHDPEMHSLPRLAWHVYFCPNFCDIDPETFVETRGCTSWGQKGPVSYPRLKRVGLSLAPKQTLRPRP